MGEQARPALTGLFFTLYVGIIFLVCMNVIIGIVTLYFDEVRVCVAACVCLLVLVCVCT